MAQSNTTTRLIDAAGINAAKVTADGRLDVALPLGIFGSISVSMDPTVAFFDPYEGSVFDTTNRWNSYGTVAPVQTQGNCSFNPSTTASATVSVMSQPAILVNTTVVLAGLISFESGTVTGNHRFWGMGVTTGNVGTAATPLTDAVGFEIDTAGVLRASVYNSGTRVFTTALTKPTDGQTHLYMMETRGDVAKFFLDDTETPVAQTNVGPASQMLPMRMHSLNGASVTGTPLFQTRGFSVVDMSRQASQISDGTLPWRKAKVDPAGALGVAQRSADLCVSVTGASAAAVTATLPAAGAGLFHYITNVVITKFAAAALTASATPTVVTTSNLPGSLAFTFATVQVSGSTIDRIEAYSAPLKSSVANTATTIVAPSATTVIWRITVQYYTGP